jgi:hypothetical protein
VFASREALPTDIELRRDGTVGKLVTLPQLAHEFQLFGVSCIEHEETRIAEGQYEPHAVALCLFQDALCAVYGDGYVIRVQSPLALDARSAPEPDLAVVLGKPRDFLTSHLSDAVLLVEITDTTLAEFISGGGNRLKSV